MERPASYIKTLRLVSPAAANQLGIPAEAPVFLSPLVRGAQACSTPTCSVTYTPLMYATGRVSTAPHFHRKSGGVYFYVVTDVVTDSVAFLDALVEHTGWIATVEPLGITAMYPGRGYGSGRAEAVLVRSITAWCRNRELDGHEYPAQPHETHQIDEGLLYPFSGGRRGWDVLLLPLCDRVQVAVEEAPLRFVVRDGTVCFRQRQ
jgi:hypothetical protein